MRKEVISSNQLFAMIVLFELGTAIIVPIGLESGHAVWISILMALPGGLLLYLIYEDLYQQYPNMIISGYTQKILGKFIGWPLSLLYIPVLMFNGSRNLREGSVLLLSSSYDITPIYIMDAMMVIAVIYILNKGIEVFARTAEIYFTVILFMGIICCSVVILAGLVDFRNIFPIHAKDWKDALKSAYPSIWIFPFGELVCFTTILPHFNKAHSSKRTGMVAVLLSGFLLTFTHAIELSVLGEDLYARSTFPIYNTITLVNLANFIQRLDALVILTLIIGVFFKLTIYCYAAMVITADLFKVKNPRKLAVPIGVVVLFTSMISTGNYPEHIEEGMVFMKYILIVICAYIPILLYIVHRIRRRFGLYR
ncbi:GerAB/ArcD/ProY family transporter [Paenibacillus crassostreae]|uniref:Spore gernimation protein GerB n=1 Tax=Paenibacillus crassostreae TaxID=1763538 RepID=A0A167GKU4_9BACL|nr:GerAB/ArcD/ProY family transporter [Paenibacillus crassostreae]AOZ92204.1 spore gernimation protein GerB [Paenibacillus crassostreae]OAB77666.1 spore gernimation protein GerB [Paenibacillus crassostreae]